MKYESRAGILESFFFLLDKRKENQIPQSSVFVCFVNGKQNKITAWEERDGLQPVITQTAAAGECRSQPKKGTLLAATALHAVPTLRRHGELCFQLGCFPKSPGVAVSPFLKRLCLYEKIRNLVRVQS